VRPVDGSRSIPSTRSPPGPHEIACPLGRRAEALRQYGRCRSLLQKELARRPRRRHGSCTTTSPPDCCTPVTTHRRELSSAVGHHRTSAARRTRSGPKESPAAPDLPPGDRAFLVLLIPNPSRAETVDATFRLAISEGMGSSSESRQLPERDLPHGQGSASAVLRLPGRAADRSQRGSADRQDGSPAAGPSRRGEAAGEGLLSAAHPGQILCEKRMADLLRGRLPTGATLLFLGTHRLKDLRPPRPVHQLCHPDLPHQFPRCGRSTAGANNLLTQPRRSSDGMRR